VFTIDYTTAIVDIELESDIRYPSLPTIDLVLSVIPLRRPCSVRCAAGAVPSCKLKLGRSTLVFIILGKATQDDRNEGESATGLMQPFPSIPVFRVLDFLEIVLFFFFLPPNLLI
jgi:hypothetical protein